MVGGEKLSVDDRKEFKCVKDMCKKKKMTT